MMVVKIESRTYGVRLTDSTGYWEDVRVWHDPRGWNLPHRVREFEDGSVVRMKLMRTESKRRCKLVIDAPRSIKIEILKEE